MARRRSLLRGWPRTVAAPLPPLAVALLRAGSRRRRIVAADRHRGAVGEPREAGGYHLLIRLETAGDDRLALVLLLHRNRPHRRLVVGADDVDEGAVR